MIISVTYIYVYICHLFYFSRGSDTVLGETSNSSELFGCFECDDEEIGSIYNKCNVCISP